MLITETKPHSETLFNSVTRGKMFSKIKLTDLKLFLNKTFYVIFHVYKSPQITTSAIPWGRSLGPDLGIFSRTSLVSSVIKY